MARSKVATRARRADVRRRASQGTVAIARALAAITDPAPDASRVISAKDLLEQFRIRLDPLERTVSDRRADGRSWGEIAAALGGTPESLRKRLTRALDRVARELGLDDPVDL
jgi:RNA polymerase sigma-70 factor (ECF subfamily)